MRERDQDDPPNTRSECCIQEILEPARVGVRQEAFRVGRKQDPRQVDYDVNTIDGRMKRLRFGKVCQDGRDVRMSLKTVWQRPPVVHQAKVMPIRQEMLCEQAA